MAAGGQAGIGYIYADTSVAALIMGRLAGVAQGRDARCRRRASSSRPTCSGLVSASS